MIFLDDLSLMLLPDLQEMHSFQKIV